MTRFFTLFSFGFYYTGKQKTCKIKKVCDTFVRYNLYFLLIYTVNMQKQQKYIPCSFPKRAAEAFETSK